MTALTFIVALEAPEQVMRPGALRPTTLRLPRMRHAELVGMYVAPHTYFEPVNDNQVRS